MAELKGLDTLRSRWERLTERERLSLVVLAVAAFVMLFGVGGFFISRDLSDLEEENAAIRKALRDIEDNRDTYQRVKQRLAASESRLSGPDMHLAGYLENIARETEIEINEINEKPAQPGKRYVERTADVRIRTTSLPRLAHFLRRIETGPTLVAVIALHVRTRDDRHEDLEVNLTVGTWERAHDKPERKGSDKPERREGAGASGGRKG